MLFTCFECSMLCHQVNQVCDELLTFIFFNFPSLIQRLVKTRKLPYWASQPHSTLLDHALCRLSPQAIALPPGIE